MYVVRVSSVFAMDSSSVVWCLVVFVCVTCCPLRFFTPVLGRDAVESAPRGAHSASRIYSRITLSPYIMHSVVTSWLSMPSPLCGTSRYVVWYEIVFFPSISMWSTTLFSDFAGKRLQRGGMIRVRVVLLIVDDFVLAVCLPVSVSVWTKSTRLVRHIISSSRSTIITVVV